MYDTLSIIMAPPFLTLYHWLNGATATKRKSFAVQGLGEGSMELRFIKGKWRKVYGLGARVEEDWCAVRGTRYKG